MCTHCRRQDLPNSLSVDLMLVSSTESQEQVAAARQAVGHLRIDTQGPIGRSWFNISICIEASLLSLPCMLSYIVWQSIT